LGSAGIDQNRERQRQVAIRLKSEDLLWHAIFQNAHIFAFEIADKALLLIRGSEENVREIRLDAHYFVRTQRHFVFLFWRSRGGLRKSLSAARPTVVLRCGRVLGQRSARKTNCDRSREQQRAYR